VCRYEGGHENHLRHGQGTFTSKHYTFDGLLKEGRPVKGFLIEDNQRFSVTYAKDCKVIEEWPDPVTKVSKDGVDVNAMCSDGKPHVWVITHGLQNDKTDRGGKGSVNVLGVGGGGVAAHSMHDHGQRAYKYCTKCDRTVELR